MYYTFDEDETREKRAGHAEGREVMDAVEFARARLKFEPDERQAEVLRSEAKRGILNCSRQWGKSTIAAAKAVHRAYTRAKSLVLVASPTDRQSAELLRKAAEMVMELGIRPRGDGDNEISLRFPNGSRIVGLPGMEGTIRGFSAVSLMLIDEAARVEDAMYKALRPMLAVGHGDLWLMSTPYGKRGFFYECWEHEGPEWFRVSVPATECPRIPAEFLEAERRAIGPMWFAQEYLCEFVDSGTALFGGTPWSGLWMTALPRWSCSHLFYLGIDLGQRHDPTAIAVVERMDRAMAGGTEFQSLRVRHLERVPLGTPYPGVVARVREITRHDALAAGRCALAVDGTGVGAPVVDMLRAAGLGCDISPVTITGGERQHQNGAAWSVPKRDLLALVQVLLERNELKLARGLRELGALVRELSDVRATLRGGGRVRLGADGCGEHDDLVIALALACWRARRGQVGFVARRLTGI